MMPEIYMIIQARMGSTRLPGKVFMNIDGLKLIDRVVKQLRETKYSAKIYVATTTKEEDTELSDYCAEVLNVSTYRGPSEDVLKRYWDCYSTIGTAHCEEDVILRVTADDPFKCPELIHDCVDCMLQDTSIDYASNITSNAYPEGLDVEVIRARALKMAHFGETTSSDREHVTQFFIRNPSLFKNKLISFAEDYSKYRLTVDYESDIKIAQFLARSIPLRFSWKDIKKCLDANEDFFTSSKIPRYEGLKKN